MPFCERLDFRCQVFSSLEVITREVLRVLASNVNVCCVHTHIYTHTNVKTFAGRSWFLDVCRRGTVVRYAGSTFSPRDTGLCSEWREVWLLVSNIIFMPSNQTFFQKGKQVSIYWSYLKICRHPPSQYTWIFVNIMHWEPRTLWHAFPI